MMAAVFIYSLKVSVCLGVLYWFYYLVLRNHTFYTWNRWYLFLGSAFCLLIPLVASLPWLESQQVQNMPVVKVIPTLYTFSVASSPTSNSGFYPYFFKFWLPLFFFLGVLIQGTRLGIQFWSFYQLRRHASRLPDSSVTMYQVNQNIAPFSFGNSVFLNSNLLQPAELSAIIRHELVHIHQKHTFDVLWLEFMILFQWYNPLVYLLKRAVRQNLEFIADREVVINAGTDKMNYQYLLVKVIGLPALSFAHQFNKSPLKTRIKMMNKMPSSKRELVKFLLVFPVMALLLLACQKDADSPFKNISKAEVNVVEVTEAEVNDVVQMTEADLKAAGLLTDAPPPPPPPPAVSTFNFKEFHKQNPDVKNIITEVQGNEVSSIVIELKSGKRETYNFKNEAELAHFRHRYGNLPVQNLPPPPPPAVREFVMLPSLDTEPLPAAYKAFLRRYPRVKKIGWDKDGALPIIAPVLEEYII